MYSIYLNAGAPDAVYENVVFKRKRWAQTAKADRQLTGRPGSPGEGNRA